MMEEQSCHPLTRSILNRCRENVGDVSLDADNGRWEPYGWAMGALGVGDRSLDADNGGWEP